MTTTPPEAPPAAAAAGPGSQDGPRVTRDEIRDLGPAAPQRHRPQRRRRRRRPRPAPRRRPDHPARRVRGARLLRRRRPAACTAPAGCWCPRRRPATPPSTLDDRSRTVALVVVGVLAALLALGDSWGGLLVPVAAGGHRPRRLAADLQPRPAPCAGAPALARAYGPPAAGVRPAGPRRGDVRLGRQHRRPGRPLHRGRRQGATAAYADRRTPDRRPPAASDAPAARPAQDADRSCSGSPWR